MLEIKDLKVAYGRVRAVKGISFTVEEGQVVTLVGTNGAGKTTTLRTISGLIKPEAGEIWFQGKRIDAVPAHEITVLGLAHSPEGRRIFPRLTVEDNLLLALKADRRPFPTLWSRRTASERERIHGLLERVRLKDSRRRNAGDLSHGQKQWLEIGMLLAQEPKLLLVDEPAAGMTDQETADTADLLRDIAKTRSVVVVEHDMVFVRDLGVKVTCLHEGSVLSEGTLDAVSADERVIEVYLGR